MTEQHLDRNDSCPTCGSHFSDPHAVQCLQGDVVEDLADVAVWLAIDSEAGDAAD